jgi:hypothetical protein
LTLRRNEARFRYRATLGQFWLLSLIQRGFSRVSTHATQTCC